MTSSKDKWLVFGALALAYCAFGLILGLKTMVLGLLIGMMLWGLSR
jgi:hypothetical protein